MSKKIALVSCVKSKGEETCPARSLFKSDWFEKAVRYATQVADKWFLLSSKYGFILPDQEIAPYDVWLKKMPLSYRKKWAQHVFTELQPYLKSGDTVIFLAGEDYRQFLIEPVIKMGCKVEIPMQGLGIGLQKQWLKKQLREG